MEYRGPILLVFGASLIMSPIAVNVAIGNRPSAPQEVQTDGAAAAACDAASVITPSGRLGCQSDPSRTITRRVMEGGATFVSARK